jgi:hypothetical protein
MYMRNGLNVAPEDVKLCYFPATIFIKESFRRFI